MSHHEFVASPLQNQRSSSRSGSRRRRSRPLLRSTAESRARLCLVLLVYYVVVVAVVALAPFGFSLDADVRVVPTTTLVDAVGSVLLFLPLGFLYPLTRPRRDPPRVQILAWGTLIAVLVMLAQLFEADRETPLIELFTATLGVAIGMELLGVVNRRMRASTRFSGRLSLELPLVGLIYMLMPVVLTTSFGAPRDPERALLLIPLALLAARLFAAVQQYHFGPAGVFSDAAMSLIAGGWLAVASFPAFVEQPLPVLVVALVAALGTYHWSRRAVVHGLDRRFEGDALRAASPFLAAYFLGVAALPVIGGVGPWHMSFGLTGAHGELADQIVALLEPITSFAMLGYVLAEWRGRRELPFRAIGLRVAGECLGVALLLEASRAVQPEAGASLSTLVLSTIAGVVGARIYHQQRERVRSVLIHRREKRREGTALVSLRSLR